MKRPILAVPLDEEEKAAVFEYESDTTKQKDLLGHYVDRFIAKNHLGGYETGDIAIRKLAAAVVFAIVLAAEIAWYALYHRFPDFVLKGLCAVELIVFLVYSLSQNLSRFLVRQVISRPEDNIDNILISQVSGARSGLRTRCLMLIPILVVLGIAFFAVQKPHMIFEKNAMDGYSVRYYTWSLHPEDTVVVPETYQGLPVNEIRGNVFTYLTFRSVRLPSGLTQIRASTFEHCENLTKVVIPEGVTRIASHAFCDCHQLSSVTIPRSVKEIRSSAFRRCYQLRFVSVPAGVSIAERAFKESPTRVSYY